MLFCLLFLTAKFIFPISQSLLSLKSSNQQDHQLYVVYWAIISLLQLIDFITFDVLYYIPFIEFLQTLLCIWLLHPEYKGALYLYQTQIKKIFLMIEQKLGQQKKE